MNIIFATGNKNKLREAREILGEEFSIGTPEEYGVSEEIPETSDTIKGNAIQKAQYLWERTAQSCFADDTGLEVDCLGGAPGVYSARYAGESKSSDENIKKLLHEMEGVPFEKRTARFRCVIALVIDGKLETFDGVCEGHITFGRKGEGGFGYDPVFQPEGYSANFSELKPEEKNAISHRGKAMRLLAEYLKSIR